MREKRKGGKKRKILRSALSAGLACSMVLGLCSGIGSATVHAQQTVGNAPFINSWLVSGPFDEPVADVIYNTDGTEVPRPERPADGNWAPYASAAADSEHRSGNYPAKYAVDKDLSTTWSSDQGGDGLCTLSLSWGYTIEVQRIEVYDRNDAETWGDCTEIECRIYGEDDALLDTVTIAAPGKTEPGVVEFEEKISGVKKIEMDLLHTRADAEDYGLAEVYVLDGEASDPGASERPDDGNWASKASAAANSVFNDSYSAANAIDGNVSTEWASNGSDGVWPKTMTLEWESPIEVKRIEALSRWSDSGSDNVESVTCTLYDAEGTELAAGETTDPKSSTVGYLEFDEAVTGVRKIELVLNGPQNNGNKGFREVYVLDGQGVTIPEQPDPLGDISPEKGETFGTEGGTQKEWEYFDDRIWNRTYDDYQDLYGYFTVKKGLDTRNKYVFAHTYVYSDKEQTAQVRVGATGSCRIFLNDVPVTGFSQPAEVQKDMTVENVVLKEGWNKLLLEISHTFTEDLNSNGIPVAKDADVSYLGFYARLTDRLGGEIEGLT